MTSFHESIKSILAEFEKFLSETLKKEKLSKKVTEHKQLILEKILNLQNEYPQLKPSGQDTDKGEDSQTTGGSNEEENAYADSAIAATPVSELTSPLFEGFLEKKQVKKGLFGGKLQKRWCIIKNGIFYYFENKTDKKQHGAFKLEGYAFTPAPDVTKESKKKELSFEVSADGKRAYQFVAPSKDEFDKWKKAVSGEDPNPIADDVYEETDDISAEPEPIAEDVYEDPENSEPPPPVPKSVEKKTDKSLPPLPPTPAKSEPEPEPEPIEEDIYEEQDFPEDGQGDLIEEDVYEDASSTSLAPPPVSKTPPSPIPQRQLPDVPAPPLGKRTLPDVPSAPPAVPGREKNDEDEPPPPPVPRGRPPNVPLPPTPKEQPLPKPKKRLKITVTCKPDEDFENKFYGKWDCDADNDQELPFKKGDIIHIINRDYDEKGWWVGELKDKFGLVPKSYLTPAYKLAPGQ